MSCDNDKTYEPCSCGCGGSSDCTCDCNECAPVNCIEQAIRDALATLQEQLEALVKRAEDAAKTSEDAAAASAASAAEAKDYRDAAELAATTATDALKTITDVAVSLEATAKKLQEIADELATAIAGIAVVTWYYTAVSEGQTVIPVPDDKNALAVQCIYIEGARQEPGRGFVFDKTAKTITLAEGIPLGLEISIILGTYSDNPTDFPQTLASNNGASLIGSTSGQTIQQELDTLKQASGNFSGALDPILSRLAGESGLPLVGTFEAGATVTTASQSVGFKAEGKLYTWAGTLPKTVPAGSTPATAGGIAADAWVRVDQNTLRSQFADVDGVAKYPELQMARWRDAGDVRGWGCICDGLVDDSDNFQAAVAYSELHDKALFIPGPMRITKTIVFTKPPEMRGFKYSPPVLGKFQGVPYAHKGCIIYSEVPSGLVFDINPPSNNQYIRGIGMIDIHVLARGDGTEGKGVRIANCGWGGYVRGLVVEGFKNGGLELSQLQDTLFDQLEVLSCGKDNVVAALEITNGSNLLAFNRIRLEANEFQLNVKNSMMLDFIAPHLEQGDYPGAPMPEFEKINRYPSVRFVASQNVKFTGGFIFGATIQKQMAAHSITASECPFHVSVGGDCSNINFCNVTMGFGYASGRILEHHGNGQVANCNLIALCTETYPLLLDGNIMFQNNSCAYQDNATDEGFNLMAANFATIENNIFACVNSDSVNKQYGSLFVLTAGKPVRLGVNQFIINKRARFHDGTLIVIAQAQEGSEPSAGGAINMQQFNPYSEITLYGGAGGAATVTALNNMSANQKTVFTNTGTGNITITNGGNIRCKGSVNADVPPGASIKFKFNGNSGVSFEVWRTF